MKSRLGFPGTLVAGALLMACCAALPAAPAAASVKPSSVTITTPDGVPLAGTFWAQPGRAPAVLLLHQMRRDRSDWEDFGDALAADGYSVLSIDFRGMGASTQQGTRRLDADEFSGREARGFVTDAEAGVDWLAQQASVDPKRISVVGASIGANAALLAGATDKRVCTLVLLSPGLDYHGLKTERAMEQFGTRPVFLVAGEKDEESAGAARRLETLARGRRALKLFKGEAHGTDMLAREPTLRTQIEGWLKQNH